ncbi:uncharacterized protein TNCV_378141 [Trichonephila clavipes]|nr:uncharacterized protein TNCV_378141 [Trichonephila clavipes]
MPPNTLRVHAEYVLVKSVGLKVLWGVAAETTGAEGWRIFPSPPVPYLNCGGGDTWCRHLSYRSPTYLRLCQLSFLPLGKDTTTTFLEVSVVRKDRSIKITPSGLHLLFF